MDECTTDQVDQRHINFKIELDESQDQDGIHESNDE
jgi:hypothetical protein